MHSQREIGLARATRAARAVQPAEREASSVKPGGQTHTHDYNQDGAPSWQIVSKGFASHALLHSAARAPCTNQRAAMLRAFIVIVGFVTIGLSTMAIPFVLSGVVDSTVPFFSVVVVAGTAILVLSEISSGTAHLYRAIRSRRVSRRKAISVVCWAALGGTIVTSWLGYFSVSPLRYVALLPISPYISPVSPYISPISPEVRGAAARHAGVGRQRLALRARHRHLAPRVQLARRGRAPRVLVCSQW